MPTYEYACSKCDEHFDVFQSFSEDPLKRHRGCGGKLSKVLGSVGIVLKGSGFYRNDSRSGSSKPAAEREKSDSSVGSGSDSQSDSADSGGKESSATSDTSNTSDGATSSTGSTSNGDGNSSTKPSTKSSKSSPKSSESS